MAQTAIFTLTSELHDEQAVDTVTKDFLDSLGVDHLFRGSDYSDYGSYTLNLIFVRTGGTEGIFKGLFPELQEKSDRPFYLLTSGKSNSLAASMEILSYLRQNHLCGRSFMAGLSISPAESYSWKRSRERGKRWMAVGWALSASLLTG